MGSRCAGRVGWIAVNTFTEAVRQKFFAFVLILAAALGGSGTLLRTFNFGQSELKFVADLGFGAVFFFGSLLAVVMTVQLFFSELDNRTALTLLAKPVRRWEFVLGKFLGVWTLLGMFVALLGLVLGWMLASRASELLLVAADGTTQSPYLSLEGLVVYCALQWLRLGVVAAVTLVICGVARTFLYAVIVSTLAVLACQMQAVAMEGLLREDRTPLLKGFAWAVRRLVPDLQLFDLGVPLVLQPEGVSAAVLGSAFGYGLLYLPVLLALAMYLFLDREI